MTAHVISHWDVPLEYRLRYRATRRVRLTRHPLRWIHSALREVGEFLFGAFQPIVDAL